MAIQNTNVDDEVLATVSGGAKAVKSGTKVTNEAVTTDHKSTHNWSRNSNEKFVTLEGLASYSAGLKLYLDSLDKKSEQAIAKAEANSFTVLQTYVLASHLPTKVLGGKLYITIDGTDVEYNYTEWNTLATKDTTDYNQEFASDTYSETAWPFLTEDLLKKSYMFLTIQNDSLYSDWADSTEENNVLDEYVITNLEAVRAALETASETEVAINWERIGTTGVTLKDYYNKTQVDALIKAVANTFESIQIAGYDDTLNVFNFYFGVKYSVKASDTDKDTVTGQPVFTVTNGDTSTVIPTITTSE